MNDRRFDLRVPMADPVDLWWTDHGQTMQDCAQLADISRSGASVRSRHPVKVGTVLSLRYRDQEFVSKVRHCVSASPGYLLGIEFEEGYRWSPRASR